MKTCLVSIDVENDLNAQTFESISRMNAILSIFDKYKIKASLYVTGDILKRFPDEVKKWSKKHEISMHALVHEPLFKFNSETRKNHINEFLKLYEKVLGKGKKPAGYRAVQHTIDQQQMLLLNASGFLYDSSVVPAYIPFRKYVGYKGKAPQVPYNPSATNYKKKGNLKIVELPVTPLICGVSLYGTWIRIVPQLIYSIILLFKKPKFLSLAMHPWDALEYNGELSRNSGKEFLKRLELTIQKLKKYYRFVSGEDIANGFNKSKTSSKN